MKKDGTWALSTQVSVPRYHWVLSPGGKGAIGIQKCSWKTWNLRGFEEREMVLVGRRRGNAQLWGHLPGEVSFILTQRENTPRAK